MSLYLKYRPYDLSQVKGNADVISSLEGLLSKDKIESCPHTFLLHGQTGCGKTTVGRIIANMLGCVGEDFVEINSASFRGIDTVREIINNSQFMPIEGLCRVWLIDECFAKGTLITLKDNSNKEIQNIQIGENIFNLKGGGKVTNIFKNKININKIVYLTFSNKSTIICSEDHLFMTSKGWVKAKNLKNNLVYKENISNFTSGINSLINNKNGKNQILLPKMSQTLNQKAKEILLSFLFRSSKDRTSPTRGKGMSNLWKEIYDKILFAKYYLWEKMRQYFSWTASNRTIAFSGITSEISRFQEELFFNQRGEYSSQKIFRPNENKQSLLPKNKYPQRQRNKEDQWDFTYLDRKEGREWITNPSTNSFGNCFRLGDRTSNKNRKSSTLWFWLSYLLQSRYSKSSIKNSNRSRWRESQLEKSQITRLKEGRQIEELRMENITFYKYGGDQLPFSSIIGDKERNQGFVEFYDLEIDNHPSYFANSILVHNCHKLTNDAQNALLKILEDTPSHVYFILCTTEPQKLIATIKGRCLQFQLLPLSETELKQLLRRVAHKEGDELEDKVLDQIVGSSKGFPRNALQILEVVLSATPDKRMEAAKKAEAEVIQSIELCRALAKKASWKEIAKILEGLKDQEPEGIRRAVLGYCQAVLLKGTDQPLFGLIMEEFATPTYDNGFIQITYACYSVCKA